MPDEDQNFTPPPVPPEAVPGIEQESVAPAKHKKKGKFKKFLLIFFGLIILLVVLFFTLPHIFGIVLGRDDPPPSDSDLLLTTVNISDNENSYYDLMKLDKLIDIPADVNDLDFLESYDWSSSTVAQILERNLDALAVFSEAADKPFFQYADTADPKNINGSLPVRPLNIWRKVSRISGIKAINLMKLGHDDEAFKEAFKSVRNGYQIQESRNIPVITYLVGLAMEDSGLDLVQKLIDLTSLSSAQMSLYQQKINDYLPTSNDDFWKANYVNFKSSMNSVIAEVKEESGFKEIPTNNFYFKPNQTFSIYAENVRKMIKYFNEDCTTQAPKAQIANKLDANLVKLYFTENAVGKMLTSLPMTTLENVKIKRCKQATKISLIEMLMAVKRYRIAEGEYPTTSDILVPDYLTSIPIDYFDNQPLIYDSNKKIIYSIGPDFIDNGGGTIGDGLNDMADPTVSFDFPVVTSQPPKATTTAAIDSDNDGLSDFEEVIYGTSSDNPDTDGDGYTDGEEVMSEHNPMGSSLLTEQPSIATGTNK